MSNIETEKFHFNHEQNICSFLNLIQKAVSKGWGGGGGFVYHWVAPPLTLTTLNIWEQNRPVAGVFVPSLTQHRISVAQQFGVYFVVFLVS